MAARTPLGRAALLRRSDASYLASASRGGSSGPGGRKLCSALQTSSSAAPEAKFYLLSYDYVPDILEKRGPYRAGHLAAAQELERTGELLLGGALKDTQTDVVGGAAFAFKCADVKVIEDFVENDPYVINGLVTGWKIAEYAVAVGSAQ